MPENPIANSEDAAETAPLLSLSLAYLAMVPLIAAALASIAAGPALAGELARFGILWSAALLCFFAGVRRGLSFRQVGGATFSQIATMTWLFVLGIAALLLPYPVPALIILLLGFCSMWFLDPVAVERQEAPRYFTQLRQKQLVIPICGIVILMARCVLLKR